MVTPAGSWRRHPGRRGPIPILTLPSGKRGHLEDRGEVMFIERVPGGPWRYPAALGIIGASTAAAELLYRLADNSRPSMVFMAGVLLASVYLGSGPAYLAASAAFLAYNFYLTEPRFSLAFESEDLVVLGLFFLVANLTGALTGRLRDETTRARARARINAALFQASRDFSAVDDEAAIREGLAGHLALAVNGEAVVWSPTYTAISPDGARLAPGLAQGLAAAARRNDQDGAELGDGWRARPLRPGEAELGAVAWRPASADVEQVRLVDTLADIGAAAVARARLAAARGEMAALAQTERLQNALLSSISHDLRTPLAAILASATSLREFGDRFDQATRADLETTIHEEAERLNLFVSNLLNMTRLESGALRIEPAAVAVTEVLDRVAERVGRRAGGRRLTRAAEGDGLQVECDPILLEYALVNVVENAVRFSPEGGEVDIAARRLGDQVVVEVADEGPGVPDAELGRIFEKFHHAPGDPKLQGAGLGLSITRGLVEGMGGCVEARRRGPGGGLVVSLMLKRAT